MGCGWADAQSNVLPLETPEIPSPSLGSLPLATGLFSDLHTPNQDVPSFAQKAYFAFSNISKNIQ